MVDVDQDQSSEPRTAILAGFASSALEQAFNGLQVSLSVAEARQGGRAAQLLFPQVHLLQLVVQVLCFARSSFALRFVMSSETPTSLTIRPLASQIGEARLQIQRNAPSEGITTRYSLHAQIPEWVPQSPPHKVDSTAAPIAQLWSGLSRVSS